MKKYWWLIAIALVVFFGNAQLAVTDPVESNYTLTAKEMLSAGDYISPRIYGNYWYDKPIFFYWELIAAFGVGGIWYWQMYQLHGMDFLTNFLGVHNFLRATVSEHPRFDVWYYYIVIFLLGLFPWSLGMVARALRRWRNWRTAALRPTPVRFLLIWALTVNIVLNSHTTRKRGEAAQHSYRNEECPHSEI